MRQWASAFAILMVVAMMATFAIVSIVTVVHATTVLQQSVPGIDDLAFDEITIECDLFDSFSCI